MLIILFNFQLNQVQDTINSLYETINNEQNPNIAGGVHNVNAQHNFMQHMPTVPQPLIGNYPRNSSAPNIGGMTSYINAISSQGEIYFVSYINTFM